MGRPVDWQPLADSDPIPGDVHAITVEAARLKATAQTIRTQITRLRQIGSASNLKGQSVTTIRSAASSLADKLESTATRYEKVSGALTGWSSELEWSQQQSLQALTAAQDAQRRSSANSTPVYDPKKTPHPTPAQQTQEQQRVAAQKTASGDLSAAEAQLATAVNHRDEKGSYYRGQIESASDDALKDSTWDGFKDWVDQHQGFLNALADICGWIATALAVVALFVSGGWVIALLVGITLLALAAHTALALAGDGSWLAVGLDLLSLCFVFRGLAVAGKVGEAVEASQAAIKEAAPELAEAAQKDAYAVTKAARSQASRVFKTAAKGSAEYEAARAQASVAMTAVRAAYRSTFSATMKVAEEDVTKLTGLKSIFSSSFLKNGDGIEACKEFFTNAAKEIPSLGKMPEGITSTLKGLAYMNKFGFGVDFTNHILGGSWTMKNIPDTPNEWKTFWSGWGPWNNPTTMAFGSAW